MAWGTTAYAILVGLSAGIGLVFLALGLIRRPLLSTELFVGIAALGASGQTLATLRMHSSQSIDEYEALLDGPFSYWGVITLISIVWLIGLRTGVGFPRFPLAMTGVGLIMIAVNALGSGGLIVDDVIGLREVSLFGEAFVVHTPGPGSLQWLLLPYLLVTTGYLVWGMVARWRTGAQRVDPLLIGVAGAWIINVYDTLVDQAVVSTSYLAPFGLVALISGLAVERAGVVMKSQQALVSQSARLENVVSSRTEALRVAQQDLVAQLDSRNRSSLRLAGLSEWFLSLSGVGLGDDDIREVLQDAMRSLGGFLDATEARLEWELPDSSTVGSVGAVAWVRPDPHPAERPDNRPATIDRALEGGDLVLGHLTIRRHGTDQFSDEQRRIADLSSQYLTGFFLRLQLESSHVHSAVDRERQRIARELHDSLSQRLYAAAFNAEAVTLSVGSDPVGAAESASKIRSLALSTLAELRTLLFELHPSVLATQTLTDLVAQLCASVEEIYQRPVDLAVVHNGPLIPTEPKLALYRIVQESVGNALRHSEAINVNVAVTVDDTQASIMIIDDGIGFDPGDTRAGHGLRNMRERAAEADLALEIISRPGAGATVTATWTRRRSDAVVDLTDSPRLEVVD